jgi:hypothetical protein
LLWNKFCIASIFTNIKSLFESAISSFGFEGLPKSGLAFTNAFKSHAKRWNFEILTQWNYGKFQANCGALQVKYLVKKRIWMKN